uniref:Uncharacterized protein n=1 Tax=Lepeophtheirus salmonis TaxID=72036 RepID=A0A0K2T7B9_LEPSM
MVRVFPSKVAEQFTLLSPGIVSTQSSPTLNSKLVVLIVVSVLKVYLSSGDFEIVRVELAMHAALRIKKLRPISARNAS